MVTVIVALCVVGVCLWGTHTVMASESTEPFVAPLSSGLPDVRTMSSVINITANSASIWGWIADDGGSEIIDRRFGWGTSLPPSNAVYSRSISGAGDFFWINLTGLSPNTTYYFRAWAKNRSTSNYPGLPAGWSRGQIQSFITASALAQRPSPPHLTEPGWSSAPGQMKDTLLPTFCWEAVPNAERYALAISVEPYGSANVIYRNTNLTGTSFTLDSFVLEYGGKYRWNMQAGNSAGCSDVSSLLYFQIMPLPVQPPGSLRMTIEPSGARTAGAQWRLTNGPDTGWKNSGVSIHNLPSDSTYNITFSSVSGWTAPGDRPVTIAANATAIREATYQQDTPVQQTLATRAVANALDVIGAPYELGGTGRHWDQKKGHSDGEARWATPEEIKATKYRWWRDGKLITSTGLDCCGLVMWAYSVAYDSNCTYHEFMREGVSGQWESERIREVNSFTDENDANAVQDFGTWYEEGGYAVMQLGDLIYFLEPTKSPHDHVVMYIGNGEIVHATKPKVIKESLRTALDRWPGWFRSVGVGRVTIDQDSPPPADGIRYTYGQTAGWYMVSAPRNNVAADLFGTTVSSWNPVTHAYVEPTTIEPGKGYWVQLPANKSITITGAPITADVTINVSTAGWHQISAPWSYPIDEIRVVRRTVTKSWPEAVAAGWVRGEIYGYKATDGEYTTPATINPWYGYWMRAEVSDLLLMLRYASGTPVTFAPMATPLGVAPADLPPIPLAAIAPYAADLTFGNYPNPIVDINTTTFMVRGPMAVFVEQIRVQIFDLFGRLVYEQEEAGMSLDWHTNNMYGEYLANGVYLYMMYAKIDGEWAVSEVKKLVILR